MQDSVEDTPVLTYLRKNNNWESHTIPEGYVSREDEYILTTSFDKSVVYFLLPQKADGYFWDLVANKFEKTDKIPSIEMGKEYIHEIP